MLLETDVLVLDFDGTMTDAEAEGGPYRAGYLADLATLCGVDSVEELAVGFEAEVAANPDAYGWMFGGTIVAPAVVDPYLRVMPVARKILDHFGVFTSPDERDRLLDGILYKYNYPKTLNVFRDGAYEVLSGLEGQPVYVVTNSHTDAVREKLADLGCDWLVPRVFGRAKKYVIDDGFEALPASMALPGLSRPVLLRRKLYFDVLQMLLEREGQGWDELLVVGDIFELDLCVPFAQGARVGLVTNPFTPGYEKDFLASQERGFLIEDIRQIPGLL
ncbi:MAG: HAD family hydrolase [Proteobacteria bacterium]|nr:HAD family hydrolase [Pseudomonadota bacterium]MCP4918634.1 HAD family hydrolase [Pseudomonadota bacterium]